MLQVARYALFNPGDATKFTLIYANVNEDDILLRVELDYLVAMFPYRFKVYYVLNNPPAGWKGGVGFVSKEHIEEHFPLASASSKVLICGTPSLSFFLVLPFFLSGYLACLVGSGVLIGTNSTSYHRTSTYGWRDEGPPRRAQIRRSPHRQQSRRPGTPAHPTEIIRAVVHLLTPFAVRFIIQIFVF